MRLRIKFYYASVGFQVAGAFLFALLGRLGHALLASVFAMLGWYLAEHHLNKELNNKIGE